MSRTAKLNEHSVKELASKYLAADPAEKKALLKQYGVVKQTLHNTMARYGIQFVRVMN